MKQLSILGLLAAFVSTPALAQGFYIPGMPVPEASSSASSAPAASPSKGGAGTGGKVAKVSVASGEFMHEPELAEQQQVQVSKTKSVEYKGVTPPERLVPENSETFTRTSANQLSWIGFVPDKDGKHKIFLQTSQATTYERLSTPANRIELVIANTKLAVANNNRELDMKYFNTPFLNAKAVRSGKNVKVVVNLKSETSCDVVQHDNMIEIVASK